MMRPAGREADSLHVSGWSIPGVGSECRGPKGERGCAAELAVACAVGSVPMASFFLVTWKAVQLEFPFSCCRVEVLRGVTSGWEWRHWELSSQQLYGVALVLPGLTAGLS
jgi:hypothetical protein